MAERPGRLRVAVVWQYGKDELELERTLRSFPQVELTKIPARYSSGCNWARSLSQRHWKGERFTLFLDSHHRFAPGWDVTLISWHEALRRQGVARPVLTGYLPRYSLHDEPTGREHAVLNLEVHERYDGLIYRLIGHQVPEADQLTKPIPGRFASLHCLFAEGRFNDDVPFDPNIYFFADEVAIALRAYTHGYDLFQPHRVIGWHLYDRSTRGTHWDDHSDWFRQNALSQARLRALYRGDLRGPHGIGTRRSIAAFEAHIGTALIEQVEFIS